MRVLKEITKIFIQDSKELLKVYPTRLFILRKMYESGETNKKKII